MENPPRNRLTDPLLGKMWKTKSSRFNADLRLKRRNSFSITATSILSFYIVVGSIFPLAFTTLASGGAEKVIALLTVITSVFLIVITLLESSKNYLQEADRMLKSAIEISGIYNRFQGLSWDHADLKRDAFAIEYNAALQKYDLNHRAIDFLKFKLQEDQSAKDWLFYCRGYIAYLFLSIIEYGFYLVLIIVPPLMVAIFHAQLGF